MRIALASLSYLITVFALALLAYRVPQLVAIYRKGQPDPTRGGDRGARLKNMFKELNADLGVDIPESGDLSPWAEQGVVLLNRTLTCRSGESNSHSDSGWRKFTDICVEKIAELGVIAILWGNNAQECSKYFTADKLITSPHPSPLSAHRGFFGSKPFSRANAALLAAGKDPIDWSL